MRIEAEYNTNRKKCDGRDTGREVVPVGLEGSSSMIRSIISGEGMFVRDPHGQNIFEAFFMGLHEPVESKEATWFKIDRDGHWRKFLDRCDDTSPGDRFFKKYWGAKLEAEAGRW